MPVVCDTAKVRFFKQITTTISLRILPCGCLRYCKSTIFQANHNKMYTFDDGRKVVCDTAKVRFFKQITTTLNAVTASDCCLRYCKSTIFQANHNIWPCPCRGCMLFAILQKYDFSSKSQPKWVIFIWWRRCLRYCKSTIFQANHNRKWQASTSLMLFAILQKYDFSSKSQHSLQSLGLSSVVCDTAKVRFFKQITTYMRIEVRQIWLFAILQKYDFSSKSQLIHIDNPICNGCLRYCKSTIFQANHNSLLSSWIFFELFAILQKYDFSSKSQLALYMSEKLWCCLRYCKSTIFQANHNCARALSIVPLVVCDTAKVRFFKQITTWNLSQLNISKLFAILQKYDFSSKSQLNLVMIFSTDSCLRYCKSTIFQANHNASDQNNMPMVLFAILQKYDFSSKSQLF